MKENRHEQIKSFLDLAYHSNDFLRLKTSITLILPFCVLCFCLIKELDTKKMMSCRQDMMGREKSNDVHG